MSSAVTAEASTDDKKWKMIDRANTPAWQLAGRVD